MIERIGQESSRFVIDRVKEGFLRVCVLMDSYLSYVVGLYKEKRSVMTTAVLLDFLYSVIRTIAMPYPKAILDDILDLFQEIVPSLKTTTDNKMKGFVWEFLEQCLDLKVSGGVDSARIDAIVSSMSSVTYICCWLCLTNDILSKAKTATNPFASNKYATLRVTATERRGVRACAQTPVRFDVFLSRTG